jgi:ABC-type polysaccharide/polyol phosphate export permease
MMVRYLRSHASVWKNLYEFRELLWNLTLREIRGKYKRTALGQGWSLLNPVVSIAIFTLVFGLFLRAVPPVGNPSGLNVFAMWLAAGLLPWTFFSLALNGGMSAITSNSSLVTKVYFPREVLVAAAVVSFVPAFVLEMSVLVVAVIVVGANPLPWSPLLVALIALLALFAFGLALILSIATVYFRDTPYLMALVLQLWFYMSPVVYPEQLVHDALSSGRLGPLASAFETIYGLNPMLGFLRAFRAVLYDNRAPSLADWLSAGLATSVCLILGVVVFTRFSPRLAEEL